MRKKTDFPAKRTVFAGVIFAFSFLALPATAQENEQASIRQKNEKTGSRAENENVILHFQIRFHGQPLVRGKAYSTASGESISITRLRFYIGYASGKTAGANPVLSAVTRYYLIDIADSSSLRVRLTLPAAKYTGINFILGVDSADQVGGAGTGALDPMKGMYWTWNSGFVTVKITGRSPQSRQPDGEVEYHLGGYRSPDKTQSLVRLSLDSGKIFRVIAGSRHDIDVLLELDRFFDKNLSLKEEATFMTPGPKAQALALKFAGCFGELKITSAE